MKTRKCITWFTKKRKTHLLEHCHWNKIIKKSQKSYRRGSLHWLVTYEKCKYSPYRLERNVGGQKICGNNNTNSSALTTSHNMIQALLSLNFPLTSADSYEIHQLFTGIKSVLCARSHCLSFNDMETHEDRDSLIPFITVLHVPYCSAQQRAEF